MEEQVFNDDNMGLFYKDFSKPTYITQMGWILVEKLLWPETRRSVFANSVFVMTL